MIDEEFDSGLRCAFKTIRKLISSSLFSNCVCYTPRSRSHKKKHYSLSLSLSISLIFEVIVICKHKPSKIINQIINKSPSLQDVGKIIIDVAIRKKILTLEGKAQAALSRIQ